MKGQLDRSNKHRAEVIEVYPEEGKAAVRFTSGRIECVARRGMVAEFYVGQKGMVDFVPLPNGNGYEWIFEPAKGGR
jgi:hypothetical protein